MMTPVVISHAVAANRVLQAPAVTGVAVFAVMQPHRLAVNHFDFTYRADSSVSSATSAVFVSFTRKSHRTLHKIENG